ncbi:MAG: internal scaffolding protein [Microvirus sp.]|nr:MAG: internal scaffolding protein [Microvirus sp.]
MAKLKFKGPYSETADDPGLQCSEILTEQHHKDRVDINNIINNYTKTGYLPDIQTQIEGLYGDFSSGDDFLESQLKIQRAEEAFMSLPAETRKRFNNQPHELLEFIQNPKNSAEAVKLGLANPLKTTEPSLASHPAPEATKTTKTN